ncbi:hypothetical protein IVA94_14745 [Bradyrhizobium sp. 156]|uniref:hypothetical protein n=1 Tax=Bradyrhizobium sp. 156 TaxID=2782630 RepID=UPI001FF7024E|nr:hypothetical protein [Bradyrhizobium sp. 156]MCK1322127.1 hypothetical protein [Bradyrhizobium sp. 156]
MKRENSNKHFPKPQRDEMARLALGIRRSCKNQEEAKTIVAGMFKVSPTTARALIMRGLHLATNVPEEKTNSKTGRRAMGTL